MSYEERLEQFLIDNEIMLSDSTFQSLLTLASDMQQSLLLRKEVISVQPGDKLVFSFDGVLSVQQHENFKEQVAIVFPENKAILLEGGMTLEVYREQEKQAIKGDGWTSNKDRLPETTATVTPFIVCDDINIWCDAWVYSHKDSETGDFKYQWQDGRPITHWKPIALPCDDEVTS